MFLLIRIFLARKIITQFFLGGILLQRYEIHMMHFHLCAIEDLLQLFKSIISKLSNKLYKIMEGE